MFEEKTRHTNIENWGKFSYCIESLNWFEKKYLGGMGLKVIHQCCHCRYLPDIAGPLSHLSVQLAVSAEDAGHEKYAMFCRHTI